MNKLIVTLIALVFLASCNDSGNQKMVDLTPTAPQKPAPTTSQPQQQQTTVVPTNTNNTESGALNPKHGAPGHRCDIPEGAPLNTAVTNPTTIPTSNPAPVILTQPTQPPSNNGVKLNPAHGEPGHDCAIPVGQPLKN
jgi:hypothetical protein